MQSWPTEQILGTLLSSQTRIGSLIGRAAVVADASREDVVAASPYVARGLSIAVAVHACDYADTIVPRLRGRSLALDHALGTLVDDHRRALVLMKRLRASLAWEETVLALGYLFIGTFALEQDVVFPAIRARLTRDERRGITREMRMRRSTTTSPTPAMHPS